MRYKGSQLKGTKRDFIVIPRPSTIVDKLDAEGKPTGETEEIRQEIVFHAEAIMDYTPFEMMCPPPSPQPKLIAGQTEPSFDYDSPDFKKKIREWAIQKQNWIIVKSLSVSPD